MSEFLDELARTLATPMPRRRALLTLGGAVVTVAVPAALRPRRASGAARRPTSSLGFCEKSCSNPTPVPCLCKNDRDSGPYAGCFETCGVPGSTCCCTKGSDGFNDGAVACPPGTRCGRRGEVNCPCLNECGRRGKCCGRDEFCANPREELCCKNEERGCGLECCKPNEECKTIRVGTGSQTFCEKRCPPRQAWCGRNKCCPPRWHCVNEGTGLCKRCRRNEEECGDKCCDRRTSHCCGDGVCCPKSRSCCKTAGGTKCCPPRHKCRTPILRGNIGTVPGTRPICCPPERVNSSPDLCCPAGTVALNTRGFRIPPPGGTPDCCPRGLVCQSGSGRICADLQSDPRNCGSCGNVCASGVCGRGVCALP